MNDVSDMDCCDQYAQPIPFSRSDQAGVDHEMDEDNDAEEKQKLFRNLSSNTLWADYCALMKGGKREGGAYNGNINAGEQGCVQETCGQQEEFDSTNVFNAQLDGCISNVLFGMVSEMSCG